MENVNISAEELEKAISKVIRDTLLRKGVSETQFALKTKLSQSNLNRLLRNEISYKLAHLTELSSALNMTLDALLRKAREQAEEDAQRSHPAPAPVPSLADLSAMTPDQLLALGLAARHKTANPLDTVGEENQDTEE